MPDKQPESSKYTIHFHGEARGVAIGDHASVTIQEIPPPPIGIPFQAPPLPAHFVPRPEVSNALKARLLTDEGTAPGALVVSAVHGLGGIGKTTLVAALAYDPDLQTRFPDGVVWATLGQQPEVLSLLVGWVQALHDYAFHPTVAESASAHLRSLLHDKACLLVVDDAWQADHVRPFLVGGERCQVLVTTRDATLARKVGARLYDLDVMTEAQALTLFQARLGPLDDNHEQAAVLAHELGYLPLALELAAAQVEAGIPWNELLNVFHQELADLAALGLDEATYRNESLRLSFRLSLERLSLEDQDAFAWLGVPPEDARLNPDMAATLWDQSEAKARQRLHRLRDKALIRAVAEEQYTVHDLLHDEAKLRLVEHIPLSEAHADLLVRYRARTQDGLWHTLPDDGYVHERLTWHMGQAGWEDEIHVLLQEETPDSKNGWFQARERLGQVAGYLTDIACAWRFTEERLDEEFSPCVLGLQCRYALIAVSLNSMAASVRPELLASLVEKGVWSSVQGLAYANQTPDPVLRSASLASLIPFLPTSRQGEIFRHALAIVQSLPASVPGKFPRAKALAHLARSLPAQLRASVWQQAIEAVKATPHGMLQAEVLADIAPSLPESLLEEALKVARGIWPPTNRIEALLALVPYFPITLLREVLEEVSEANKWELVLGIEKLVPNLPEPLLREVLTETWKLPKRLEGGRRPQSLLLAEIVPRLAELGFTEESLALVERIKEKRYRWKAWAKMIPFLQEPIRDRKLGEALDTAWAIDADEDLPGVLAILAPFCSEAQIREALSLARTIGYGQWQARALMGLAPHLPASLLPEAISASREIEDERWRSYALVELCSYLPKITLKDVLTAITDIRDRFWQVWVLAKLAPYLAAESLMNVLVMTQQIMDRDHLIKALVALAYHLPAPMRTATLMAVQEIAKPEERAQALAMIAPLLPDEEQSQVFREALEILEKLQDPHELSRALMHLTVHLFEPLQSEATNKVLAAAQTIDDLSEREEILAMLIPQMAELGYHQNALIATKQIQGEGTLSEILVAMAPYLPTVLMAEALSLTLEMRDDFYRASALAGLVPHLPSDLLEKAMVAVWAFQDEDDSFRVMRRVLPHLSGPLLRKVISRLAPGLQSLDSFEEMLAAVREISDTELRAMILAGLAPHLPSELSGHALVIVQEIWADYLSPDILVDLAPHFLPEPLQCESLRQTFAVIERIGDESDRSKALTRLAPQLAELGGTRDILDSLKNNEWEWVRPSVFHALSPHLPTRLLTEALVLARQTANVFGRARILGELSPLMAKLPRPALAQLWLDAPDGVSLLHHLAGDTRQEFLENLVALVPAIVSLGGEEAIAEIYCAIQAVGHWWP